MRERPEPGGFEPEEINRLAKAYNVVLEALSREDGLSFEIPGRELRRRIASGVIARARKPLGEPEELAALVLDDLARAGSSAQV